MNYKTSPDFKPTASPSTATFMHNFIMYNNGVKRNQGCVLQITIQPDKPEQNKKSLDS